MSSNLYRLFRYTSAPHNSVLETFTTEALAAAVRHDARPILDVLGRAGVIRSNDWAVVSVHTQVSMQTAGIIDLVLEMKDAAGPREVWFEIKIAAGESGNQLENYRRHVEQNPTANATLVTLSKTHLRDGYTSLLWQSVREAAAKSVSPHWQDLKLFLEEIGMADDYDAAINEREAQGLPDVYGLLRKAERMLVPVGKHANEIWPGSNWPDDAKQVRDQLAQQFANHGRYTIFNKVVVPVWFVVGLVPHEDGARLYVAAPTRPKATALKREVLAKADVLPSTWERIPSGWVVLRAQRPILELPTPAQALSWFKERLDELARVGLFELASRPHARVASIEDASIDINDTEESRDG